MATTKKDLDRLQTTNLINLAIFFFSRKAVRDIAYLRSNQHGRESERILF